MHLAGVFFFIKALCAFIGGLAVPETHHESFLQAGRFVPRMARQAAGAAGRVLEPHQYHQRPQQRGMQEHRPQRRPQIREMIPDRRPLAVARDQRFRRPDEYSGRQGRLAAQPFPNSVLPQHGITRPSRPQVQQARAYHVPPATQNPAEALEGKPVENKAAEAGAAAAAPSDIGSATSELATAATAIAEARRSASEAELPLEAAQCLLALQHFRLPQLGQEERHLPFEIAMAEVYTPGDKQIQVRRVSATLRHFVKVTGRVAIFELEAGGPPLTPLMPGLHNLRLGFGSLHGEQTAIQPATVMMAAAEGGRNVATAFKVLEKIRRQGYFSATEASEKAALALPVYGADLPSFGQTYAWVGTAVYSPIAAITPAYECTVKDLIEPTTNSFIPTEPASQAASAAPQAAVPPLSVGAREFIALRILTAVCNLHYSGFVHTGLDLESVVISAHGNVYLSDLEGALTVGDEEPCQPPPPLPTLAPSSHPGEEIQQQSPSSPGDWPPTEGATDIVPEAVPLKQHLSSASRSTAGCRIDEVHLRQKMAAESVALGILLYEVLTGGRLPFGLTKGPEAVKAIAALHQGVLAPSENAPTIEAELQELGVSQKWQMCIGALLSSNQRLTALDVASAYFPEASPTAAASAPGPLD